jgi:glycosyltransferase involved in cell wall biosynthesis
MRVLHVVPAPFDTKTGVVGGAERYAFELARHMARETPTRLVAFGDKESEEQVEGLGVRVIGGAKYVRGQRTNPIAAALIGELRGADVVHCHQRHVLASSLSALFCRLSRRRVYVTELGGGGWDISGYLPTDRWYHGHLHISEYSREVYGHRDKPYAHVIWGGVDLEKFAPGEAPAPCSAVVYAGRILPHKGIDDLVRAMPPTTDLQIIGRQSDDAYLAELHRLAAGKRVIFRHDCDDRALADAYRSAICVVLPSVYRTTYGSETPVPELLGQTLLEGMACGVPTICTAVASMPEIVEDGVTGFVVPPNDPAALAQRITWLREHPAEAGAMGRAGRRRVAERFTWPQVVQRCLEIYAADSRASGSRNGSAAA